MNNPNLIFISHKSEDDKLVTDLYNILIKLYPKLDGQIYFDHRPDLPLEKTNSWCPSILKEVDNSKYLIFVTSDLKHLREGGGWLYEEVSQFQKRKASRHVSDRSELNIRYIGIFLCDCDFENSLFNDPEFGSEYRKLYADPENLVLGAGVSLYDAKERIKAKIDALLSGNPSNDTASLIIDKVRAFAEQKKQADYMFSPDEIDEGLIPTTTYIAKEKNENDETAYTKKIIGFDGLCECVAQRHISLIGHEGGCGKTTLLTKLFYSHLEKADSSDPERLIPLYVDAKSLAGENHLILRHLTKTLFDEYTATTDKSTSESASMLDYEFSLKTEKPRYLLIIDGYNEIPDGVLSCFRREMAEYLPGGRYSNVRVVISGRHIDLNVPTDSFEEHTINLLDLQEIKDYLLKAGLWRENLERSMLSILSIPMYLKMYAQTVTNDNIRSKSDLLLSFVERQLEKDGASSESDETKALYSILLNHVLPIIAHRMISADESGSTFLLSQNELEDALLYASELLRETAYKRMYGEEYRSRLRESDFSSYDELDLADLASRYFVRVCRMLRRDPDGRFDFVHQIYRDFFCAKFLSEQMKYSLSSGALSAALSKKLFDGDVISFVSELLGEGAPRLDCDNCWDHSCNTDSVSLALIDKYRGLTDDDSATSLANITEILKTARNGDLSGIDLSRLNLTKASLATCHLYRYDKNGTHPTSFKDSIIEPQSIFTEKHFDEIIAACTSSDTVACIDANGVIKLWEKKMGAAFPKKIISGIRYEVRRLLFSNDGSSLFAMTDHEILEIPIPAEFSGTAEPRLVFKTPSYLSDIRIDSDGRVSFATVLNSFNYKYTDEPDAPDTHKFLCINSAACMLPSGKRLAFGHTVGYEALKIYDYSEETELWVERRFGYSKILGDFISEIEELFKSLKLYHLFNTDAYKPDARRTFFSYLQQQLEGRSREYKSVPAYVADKCIYALKGNKKKATFLFPWQKERLNAIVKKYEPVFERVEKSTDLLMHLPGRRITGISAKDNGNVILVSSTVEYKKLHDQQSYRNYDRNRQFRSTVLEIDTETFETRYIMNSVSNTPLYASYCGDDIVIRSKYHVTVCDDTANDICHVTTCPKALNNFITCDDGSFYIICAHFIYKMSTDMKCLASINNFIGTPNLCIAKCNGKKYMIHKASFNIGEKIKKIPAIDLSVGAACMLDPSELKQDSVSYTDKAVTLGEISFKSCSENLVLFKNMIKIDEYEVPYKLFVCDCDFRGVSGGIADPRYIRMLSCMGAITDTFEHQQMAAVSESKEDFVKSQADLIIPDTDCELPSPYSLIPDMILCEEHAPGSTPGTSEQNPQKTWNHINKDFYYLGRLGQADFSILEWVDNLAFCSSDMIGDLIKAGIIAHPELFLHVDRRMLGSLSKTYRFLFKSCFAKDDERLSDTVFSVYFPFGASLLKHITGKMPEDPLQIRNIRSKGEARGFLTVSDRTMLGDICHRLALNRWFTLSAKRYKDILCDYSLHSTFDTDSHFEGRANVHGYLQLGDRPVFAQAFREKSDPDVLDRAADKIKRLCLLSVYYKSLVRYEKRLNPLVRQPIIVIIGESLEHCTKLSSRIEGIYPGVRKLYTFDRLMMSEEAFEGAGCYFEFTDGIPHSVRLEDVL